ncbi:MAG: hypothetical protein PW735_06370 [Acidobacteriaceae bacterium]|nr:hypothetical protein [Acidobacteriaceae bacterium]
MPSWKGYIEVPSVRKLFVIPLAENNHGKSLIIRALVRLAGASVTGWKRQAMILTTLSGQRISALVFPSSLSEMQHREPAKTTAEDFLKDLDRCWWTYDLIILPSHENPIDIDALIHLGQRHGYDLIAVSLTKNERVLSAAHRDCLEKRSDERWTLRNHRMGKFLVEEKKLAPLTTQASVPIDSLAAHLWTRIQRTMFP